MMTSLSMMSSLLLLLGCQDPLFRPAFSDWTGCLHDGWGTRFEPIPGDEGWWATVPDERTQLYVHAAWDLLPFMTGRDMASLTLDLPRPLVAGYRSEVRELRGRYFSGQNVFSDQSGDFDGTVEVVTIDPERATVRLDIHVKLSSGEGEAWLQGVVDLRRTDELRCSE